MNGDGPLATFAVEVGPEETIRIVATIGERSFNLDIPRRQAADLGLALLTAHVAVHLPTPLAVGAPVEGGAMPVVASRIGETKAGGLPTLVLESYGETRLAFRFVPRHARETAAALEKAAAACGG